MRNTKTLSGLLALMAFCPLLLFAQFAPFEKMLLPVPTEVCSVQCTIDAVNPNLVTCRIKFAPGVPNPPDSLAPSQLQPPRWVYFWAFSDGAYFQDADSIVTYTVSEKASFTAVARMTAVYSGTKEPPLRSATFTAVNAATIASTWTAFSTSSDSLVKIVPHWRGNTVGDTVTLAITFRGLEDTPQGVGSLRLRYPESYFRFLPNKTFGATSLDPNIRPVSGNKEEAAWDVLATRKEATIFANVLVDSSVWTNILAQDPQAVYGGLVEAEITWDPPKDTVTPAVDPGLTFLKSFRDPPPPVIDNSAAFVPGYDNDIVNVRAARDPNSMEVSPVILMPGKDKRRLTYTVHFQNVGDDIAKNVVLEAKLDDRLDGNSIVTVSAKPGYFFNYLSDQRKAIWTYNSLNLPPMSQVQSIEDTKGFIRFTIDTKAGGTLRIGDSLQSRALIRMEMDSVMTNYALSVVQRPLCVPLQWGVKYQNGLPDTTGQFKSSNAILLTARLALGGIDHRLRTQARVSVNDLPVWWLQWELGGQRTLLDFPGDGQFELWQVQTTPLMLRWIPVMPPVSFFTHRRYLGISASYNLGYLADGRLNDQKFDLGNAGQRLDHGFSISADLLNILGKRGLSIGSGRQWHRMTLLGNTRNFHHTFVYAHLNF